MTRISASAPGKIMLCGEYVVLDGAPSLCLAMNRRADVVIRDGESDRHVVHSPGFADGSYEFSVHADGGFEWHTGSRSLPDFSLLEQTWTALSPVLAQSIDLVLDTTAFIDSESGRKLGLGGSAALTVALSAAIACLQQQATDIDRMIESHRRFQGGHGSGADVAVAYSGGIIDYRCGAIAEVHPLQWRSDLEYAVLWSGRAASTVQKLSQFAASGTGLSSRRALADASATIVSAWSNPDTQRIIDLFDQYTRILIGFSDDHGLGIFDAGHAELVDLARTHSVVYKPCGAGGGDVGIVLSSNKEATEGFVTAANSRGFDRLDLCIENTGVTVGNR
jgi:phosphomevalonate kinase